MFKVLSGLNLIPNFCRVGNIDVRIMKSDLFFAFTSKPVQFISSGIFLVV